MLRELLNAFLAKPPMFPADGRVMAAAEARRRVPLPTVPEPTVKLQPRSISTSLKELCEL
jgi:hypothetical protein